MTKALLVGNGPSIERNIEELKASNFDGVIFASEVTLTKFLKADIIPDYVCTEEGDDKLIECFKSSLLLKHLDIKIIHGQKTPAKVKTYLTGIGLKLRELPNINKKLLSNVGIYMWYIVMKHFDFKEIYLIGMDFAIGSKPTRKYRVDHFLKLIESYPHITTINCTGDGLIRADFIKWCDKIG